MPLVARSVLVLMANGHYPPSPAVGPVHMG